MSDRSIEVKDRRMFQADGSLRSEYRYLEDESRPREEPVVAPEPTPIEPVLLAAAAPEPRVEPAFLDLVEMVAQNAAAYLAQASGPGGAQYAGAARSFLEMLEALKRKTEGNLAIEEKQLLNDLLGRLNLALAPASPRG